MRKIGKSPEPESLTKFKESNKGNDWSLIHTDQNKHVYNDCLLQCKVDQNNLCGYTEVKFESVVHIDHFVKRDIDPSLTFDWQNMIAAVHDSRFGADFKDSIVNVDYYDKQRHKYKVVLNPVADALKNRFRYSTNGEIEPVSDSDYEAGETIRVFNLNDSSLCQRRKCAMEASRWLLQQMSGEEVLQYMADAEFPSAIEYEVSANK